MCHINYVTFCKIIYYDIVHLTNTSMNKIQKSHTYDILFCISKSQNVKLSINNLIKFEIKIVKILRCKCSEMIYLKESWRRPFNAAAFQCSGLYKLLHIAPLLHSPICPSSELTKHCPWTWQQFWKLNLLPPLATILQTGSWNPGRTDYVHIRQQQQCKFHPT